jgi:hypothetical protein
LLYAFLNNFVNLYFQIFRFKMPQKKVQQSKSDDEGVTVEEEQRMKRPLEVEGVEKKKKIKATEDDDDLVVVAKKKFIADIEPKAVTEPKEWNLVQLKGHKVVFTCFHNKPAYQSGVTLVCNHIGCGDKALKPCGFSTSITVLKQVVDRDFIKEAQHIEPVQIRICATCKSGVLRIQEWENGINSRGTVYLICKCDKTLGIHTERVSGDLPSGFTGPFNNHAIDIYSKTPTKKQLSEKKAEVAPKELDIDF